MDTPRLIPEIKVRVPVIAGSGDEVVEGLVEKVQPLTDGQRVSLTLVDGADHFFRELYVDECCGCTR